MDIKGIKMNGEILKEFSTGGGGHTYVLEVNDQKSTSKLHIIINSDKDIDLNASIARGDIITTFNLLNYERFDVVGSYMDSNTFYNATSAYFVSSSIYVQEGTRHPVDISGTKNEKVTVVGKR